VAGKRKKVKKLIKKAAILGAAGNFLGFKLVASRKGSRPDGEAIRTHPYRRLLSVIMPGRNESVVYYDAYALAENLEQYLSEVNERFSANITHSVVAACAKAFNMNPKMNRFVAGNRLYQRKGVYLTFSMKRKKLDQKAKLSAVKMKMDGEETFEDLCARINGHISVQRSGKKTYADKEFQLLDALPGPFLNSSFSILRALNELNLLPGEFIKGDGMFTSAFIANLGSVGMNAGYHHLYEWGTCPLFLMIGKVEERVLAENGKPVIRRVLPIRFSYDERIDDGFTAGFGIQTAIDILQNPHTHLGCLKEDGSDAYPLKGEVVY